MNYVVVSGGKFKEVLNLWKLHEPHEPHERGLCGSEAYTDDKTRVISGVGKGIIASSVGLPIRSMALKLNNIKIDPTINLDVAM
jgi:hypothetical protein